MGCHHVKIRRGDSKASMRSRETVNTAFRKVVLGVGLAQSHGHKARKVSDMRITVNPGKEMLHFRVCKQAVHKEFCHHSHCCLHTRNARYLSFLFLHCRCARLVSTAKFAAIQEPCSHV
jgi:hypothetical protein